MKSCLTLYILCASWAVSSGYGAISAGGADSTAQPFNNSTELTADDATSEVTFWKDVRPIFQKNCTICHSVKNIAKKDLGGGLALGSYDAALKQPKQPVIVAGKSADSKLYQLLMTQDEDKRMPKDGDPLPSANIELIRQWIDAGAPEGTRLEAESEEAAAPAPKRPATLARSFDVVLPLAVSLPDDVAKSLDPAPAKPGKLDLALRIGPLPPVTALAYSPDGKLLAMGSYGSVALWDLAAGRPVRVLDVPGAVHALVFSPDGSRLAATGGLPARSGTVRIFATDSWEERATIADHTDVVYDAAFSPDGTKIATASFDKTVRVWDAADGKAIETLKGHSDFVYAVAFTPDGKHLISSSKDRSIKVYSTETWQSERTLSGHSEDVLTVAVSPDSYSVVSAGKEPQLRWWIIENGQNNRTVSGHSGTVSELVFSRDGKQIVSVGSDKTVRVWNGADGSLVRSITGAAEWLYCVSLSPDGKFVAAGGWDGLVHVWETESGRALAVLVTPPAPDPARPQWLATTPEGYYAASDELAALGRWRCGGQAVGGAILAAALCQPEMITRALRGEPLEAPKFSKTADR